MNPLKNFVEFGYCHKMAIVSKSTLIHYTFIKLIFSLNLQGNLNNFIFVS